jgi:two-component system, cell cycle response regulator
MAVNQDTQAGMDRTLPRIAVPAQDPGSTPSAQPKDTASVTLKLYACGLEPDERQLLSGLVRVSLRRSPRLQLLDEGHVSDADVLLIGASDAAAVSWARRQAWISTKPVLWIGGITTVSAGHTVIRRPVPWSILPSMLARAMEQGPGSIHASRPAPLASGHMPLSSAHVPLQSGQMPLRDAGPAIAGAARTGSGAILVVDDSLAIRNHLRSLLESGGFSVTLADDVASAMKVMSRTAFDCVLMDVLMPGVDGYEGCRQIKAYRRGDKAVPVIMLTSKSSPFDRIRGKMAGCDAYLTKPVDPLQLGEVLVQHLQA